MYHPTLHTYVSQAIRMSCMILLCRHISLIIRVPRIPSYPDCALLRRQSPTCPALVGPLKGASTTASRQQGHQGKFAIGPQCMLALQALSVILEGVLHHLPFEESIQSDRFHQGFENARALRQHGRIPFSPCRTSANISKLDHVLRLETQLGVGTPQDFSPHPELDPPPKVELPRELETVSL
jgi:hypothetical protein